MMSRHRFPIGSVLFFFLVLSCSGAVNAQSGTFIEWTYNPQAPEAACPSMPECDAWKEFRRTHPLPYQALAFREVQGKAIVIVSEPPPEFSRERLESLIRALFGERIERLRFYRWPTGLDGWLEDVVLRVKLSGNSHSTAISGETLAPIEGPADIIDRLRLLHYAFYQTGEGFWLDEASTRTTSVHNIPEIKVSAADIRSWLADDKYTWSPLLPETSDKSTAGLYSAKVPGLYAKKSGLVALVIPRGTKLAGLRGVFHTFAVASDFLVGATGTKGGGLVLLARARQVSLSDLPPLRFETFARFARNRSTYLAQSYERQRIFAGRVEGGEYASWDWAPILLSQQLDDTEFGTLLNLADQVLKSWSQHGEVKYFGFIEPLPTAYPFGERSASDYFSDKFGTDSLVFNWNTKGFSTVSVAKDRDVLAADRTNALPILYRPSRITDSDDDNDNPDAQEDADQRAKEARDYFASKDNPLLVRVVQNVLLDQAVQTFLIIGDAQDLSGVGRSETVFAALQKEAAKWVDQIVAVPTSGNVDPRIGAAVRKFLGNSGLEPAQFARIISSPQAVQEDLLRAYNHISNLLQAGTASSKESKELALKGEALFRASCSTVSGALTEDDKGLHCEWKQTAYQYKNAGFDEADMLNAESKVKRQEAESAAKELFAEAKNLESIKKTYSMARQLGTILANQSSAADLDSVLAEVLSAANKSTTSGWIRTPSVVLSKNRVDVDSVGGHSIDLKPFRVATTHLEAPTKIDIGSPSAPKTPVEPPETVLKAQRSGSLLDEMRSSAAKVSDIKPEAWSELRAGAKACDCDALVAQTEDGTILFIRNAPPPVERVILGKSGVIDALLGPPRAAVVRFENFEPSAVENMARTTALLSENMPSGGLQVGKTVDGLFEPSRGTKQGVSVVVDRNGKEPEILTVSEEAGHAPLRDKIPWRQSRVEAATGADWTQTFGKDAELDPTRHDGVIVRFGTAPESGAFGVRVLMDPAKRSGALGRLREVVSRWISTQPTTPSPWASSIASLRESIRKQLNPLELRFFDARNKRKIRVAQAEHDELKNIKLAKEV